MLQDTFYALCKRNSLAPGAVIDQLWWEIEQNYSDTNRHYHTLTHLENLLKELEPYNAQAEDWDILLFSLFYHDIIYNIHKSNNEAKSASLAVKRLNTLGISAARLELCHDHILATKTHNSSGSNDTNLFTDADLAILGQSSGAYNEYVSQIRREYSFYPDMLYVPGRKKALKHFLNMQNIYKTPEFRQKYELQARDNIANELIFL